MRHALIAAIIALLPPCVSAGDSYVKGYVRSDGTYVAPHYRSRPNDYQFDNYSSHGNVNPYTGERGTQRHEFYTPPTYNYTPRSYYGTPPDSPYSTSPSDDGNW